MQNPSLFLRPVPTHTPLVEHKATRHKAHEEAQPKPPLPRPDPSTGAPVDLTATAKSQKRVPSHPQRRDKKALPVPACSLHPHPTPDHPRARRQGPDPESLTPNNREHHIWTVIDTPHLVRDRTQTSGPPERRAQKILKTARPPLDGGSSGVVASAFLSLDCIACPRLPGTALPQQQQLQKAAERRLAPYDNPSSRASLSQGCRLNSQETGRSKQRLRRL